MLIEWLTARCTTIDGREIWRDEIAALDTTDDVKRQLLFEKNRFQRWMDERWTPFIDCQMPGDELWRFRSPDETWINLVGLAGYALVREGAIVKTLTTMLT